MPLPKSTPDELIETLRNLAALSAEEIKIPLEELSEAEAAALIEAWKADLTRIAEGAENPIQIARDALSYEQSSVEDEMTALRALLRPRLV